MLVRSCFFEMVKIVQIVTQKIKQFQNIVNIVKIVKTARAEAQRTKKATCVGSKFGQHVVPLVLVPNLASM